MERYVNLDILNRITIRLIRFFNSASIEDGDEKEQLAEIIHDLCAIEVVEEHENAAWIPVAERLPEKTGWYFLTCINQFGHKICRVAHYDYDDWTDSKGFGVQVLAWIPMPEPYGGGE